MGQSKNNGKSVEDLLKKHDVELTGGWAKLASLIKAFEGIEWKEAGEKARALLKEGRANALAYVKEVREQTGIHSKPQKVSKKSNSKSRSKKSKEKGKIKQDRQSKNYRRLMKIAPELEEMLISGKEVYGKSKITGYMDFNLEKTFENKRGHYLALSHYKKKNGDMIPDPDMMILVDVKNQQVEALTFQNEFYYEQVYDDYMQPERFSPKEKRAQNAFLETWLLNLINQGHKIEFEEDEDNSQPVEQQEEVEKINESTDKELSFMDDDIVGEIKEIADKMILDDLIQTILEDSKKDKPAIRPVAQYFFIKRINESPLGFTIDYPPFGEIRQDYEKLVEEQKKIKKADETAKELAKNSTAQSEEISETVKHWKKLAAVIQSVEGIDFERAKEKALALKRSEEAEEYVIRAFNRKSASGINQLYKTNYQQLLRLIPSLATGKIKDQSGVIKRPKGEDVLSLKFEGMESATKTISLLSIQKIKNEEIIILAINRAGGKVWLMSRNGKFDNRADYDESSASSGEKLTANTELGSWLKTMLHYGFAEVNTKDPTADDFQHPVAILLEEFPIVIEWSEGSTDQNKGIKSLDDLENRLRKYSYPHEEMRGYSKTKVWFRGYDYYIRIDLSRTEGDYYPPNMNLLKWLKDYDPEFDWEQFLAKKKQSKKTTKKADVEDKDEIPDFEPGKVKLVEAHIKAGIDQKDIDWINKHKRGLTITPLPNMKNKTKSFEMDLSKKAMPPGWRISKTGKLYRENRSNRSDLTSEGL